MMTVKGQDGGFEAIAQGYGNGYVYVTDVPPEKAEHIWRVFPSWLNPRRSRFSP
jgi:hypothetical protein